MNEDECEESWMWLLEDEEEEGKINEERFMKLTLIAEDKKFLFLPSEMHFLRW